MQTHFTDELRKSQRLSETFLYRFWYRVQKTESCWLWIGGKSDTGYGQISRGARQDGLIAAHVASWIIHNGLVPDGLWVLHNCPAGDNRACVNPFHLFLGTVIDNNKDMVRKGRIACGERGGMAKFTAETILTIRAMREGGSGCRELAKAFGISYSHIQQITHRRRWKHI